MLEREPEARQRRAGGLVGDPSEKRGGENKNDPDAIIPRAHSLELLLAIASLLRDNRIGALGKPIDAEGAVILGNRRFVGAAEVLLGPSEAFGLVLQLQQANLGAGEHRADGIENRPRDASARIEVEVDRLAVAALDHHLLLGGLLEAGDLRADRVLTDTDVAVGILALGVGPGLLAALGQPEHIGEHLLLG